MSPAITNYTLTITTEMEDAAKLLITTYADMQGVEKTTDQGYSVVTGNMLGQQYTKNVQYFKALAAFNSAVNNANPGLTKKIQLRVLSGKPLNDFLAGIAQTEGKPAPAPYGGSRTKS